MAKDRFLMTGDGSKGDRPRLGRKSRGVLVLIALAGVLLFGTLWCRLDRTEGIRLREESRLTADHVRVRLREWIDSRVAFLDNLFDAEEGYGPEAYGGFRHHAERLLAKHDGFKAVSWLDPDGVVRVCVSQDGRPSTVGADLDDHPAAGVGAALARARSTGGEARTPVIEVGDEQDMEFAAFLPVKGADGRLAGFASGVFWLHTLVDACLAEERLRRDFRYVLKDDDKRVVFRHGGAGDPEAWPFGSTVEVDGVDQDWDLILAPSPERIAAVSTFADELLFAAGLLATALLVFILRGNLLRRETLRSSEAMYRSLLTEVVDASRVGIIILDAWRRVVWMNRSLEVYFGFDRKQLVGRDMRRVVRVRLSQGHIEDPEGFARRMFTPASLADGSYECHVLKGDGRRDRWLEHRTQGIRRGRFAGGRIDHFYDITPRKRAEVVHSRLIAAIEQGGEAVVITDPEGVILYVNPAYERSTGYTWKEAVARAGGIPKTGPQGEAFYEKLWKTLRDGETWSGRFTSTRKDGTTYEEVATVSPIRDQEGHIVNFVAVKRDVTREAGLEAQLRQAQKMEAVGKLAGGVAHDFNNLLQVIMGRSQVLLDRVPKTASETESLKEILEASKRAAGLTRQLLAFGRQQILERRVLDPNRLVKDHLRMLRRLIGEDIELEVVPGLDVGHIRSDKTQIEQVLMNLVVNARDAMPDGGRITIRTENVLRGGFEPGGRESEEPTRYAAIVVQDTGVGIAPEHLDRVFEPFFSTKEPGRGSGLGLSTVYGIVSQHDGDVRIDSRPGRGTTVRVLLPAVEGVEDADTEEFTEPVEQGVERILVVEDDPRVRGLAVEVLEAAGYQVQTASDGEAALDVLGTTPNGVDLVFSDVVMPKMGGPALLEELRRRGSSVRVLLTSGYGAGALAEDARVEVLHKPYSPRALLRKIREALDAGGAVATAGGPARPRSRSRPRRKTRS